MKYFLFGLLTLCACSGLYGQGYEKIIDFSIPLVSENDLLPIVLSDESVLLRSRTFTLLDDASELVYNGTAPPDVEYIDTLNGQVFAFKYYQFTTDSVHRVGVREFRYELDGRLTFDTTYYSEGYSPNLSNSSHRLKGAALHQNGDFSVIGRLGYASLNDGERIDSLYYSYFDQEREKVVETRFSFGLRHRVIETYGLSDNSLVSLIAFDTIQRPSNAIFNSSYLVHFCVDGSFSIVADFGISGQSTGLHLLENDQLLVAQYRVNQNIGLYIYDVLGDSLVSEQVRSEYNGGNSIRNVLLMQNGDIAISASRGQNLGDLEFPLQHFDVSVFRPDLSLSYNKRFYFPWARTSSYGLAEMPNGDLLALGYLNDFRDKLLIARITPDGTTYPNNIVGRLTRADVNCGTGSGEGLADWWLRIEPTDPERDTLYTYTDAAGNFSMRIDTGGYVLRPIPPNAYWGECPPQPFDIERGLDTLALAPTASVNYDCPLLTVGINSRGRLDRCEENTYVATYQNRGSQISEPGLIRITLDSFFNPLSSIPDWDRRDGDTLFYNIPSVAVWEEGRIVINGTLDCEETIPQQTHCTEAYIFPDSLCTPAGINWDGSSIEVNGFCTGDSVIFELRNITPNDMLQEQQYVIVEDLVLHLGGGFQLEGNERQRLAVPANGATYTLLAEQSAGHPGNSNPTVSVEGCGAPPGEAPSTGIIGQYPDDDGDPFVDISCVRNDGSERPGGRAGVVNDPERLTKTFEQAEGPFRLDVSPTGFGAEHLIDTSTILTYRMAFTNESQDTLIRLSFRDTLPAALDLATLVPGPGSFPYRFSVTPFGVLRFEMKGIEVTPGQTVFLSFQITQGESSRPGTIIRNRAGVTYQGRAFTPSNEVVLKVRKPVRYGTVTNETCILELTDLPDYFRALDTVHRQQYDSITLNLTLPVPAYAIRIDSTVTRGDSVLGVQVISDIELTDSLRTGAGCDSLVTFVVMVTTASRNADLAGRLLLYPNPAMDFVVVPFPAGVRSGEISLMDVLGRRQRVASSAMGEGVLLDLRGLSAGAYVISLAAEGRRWNSKLVIR